MFSPYTQRSADAPPADTLPLLFYLPGIDGTGLAAYRQFPSLSDAFDLRAFAIPPSDRLSFEEIVQTAKVSAWCCGCEQRLHCCILGSSLGISGRVLLHAARLSWTCCWQKCGMAQLSSSSTLHGIRPSPRARSMDTLLAAHAAH